MHPLKPATARKMIREILKSGSVVVTKHAKERIGQRGMLMTDVTSVLRGGWPSAPEFENGAFRYQVETARMVVVVEIEEDEVVVVSCWRL